jgi:hypothetical protein
MDPEGVPAGEPASAAGEVTSAETTSLVPRQDYSVELRKFEGALLAFITHLGLPAESVLVSVNERGIVFKNIEDVVTKIDGSKKGGSIYISKFIAASAAGLFDAALNYLWDETINELRQRVAHYDLSYFYDVAVNNPDKRKKLNTAEDLIKLDDSELIQGANKIGLISDLGFRHLDYVKYMRNWASAAHPNQNQITGFQLISWLETCIVEVISLPLSNVLIEIKKLLFNIKNNKITDLEGRQISALFAELTQEQVNNLAAGFFGIYTQLDSTTQTRQNVQLLSPALWTSVDEHTRQQFGIRYAKFLANNDQDQQRLARQFLDIVGGVSYIPDSIRGAEIEGAVQDLLTAHRNFNNFHNEPPFARQLQRLVGETGNVPTAVSDTYVRGIVEAYLTNASGVAWNAEPIYVQMMEQFDPAQALKAVLSFNDQTIASKLQFPLSQTKFRAMLEIMKPKISSPAARELVDAIEAFRGPMYMMRLDSVIKNKVESLRKLLAI